MGDYSLIPSYKIDNEVKVTNIKTTWDEELHKILGLKCNLIKVSVVWSRCTDKRNKKTTNRTISHLTD